MPLFIDRHPADEASAALLPRQLQPAAAGSPLHLVDYLVGERGDLFCLLEAPHAAAVRQWHAEQGLPCWTPHHVPRPPRLPPDRPAVGVAEQLHQELHSLRLLTSQAS